MDSMAQVILKGTNLGQRRRYLNDLVKKATQDDTINFDILPENTPIDKIFKIDLASAQRNADYILLSLKDDDMLYVSRALKCMWLLDSEYSNVINPKYLETEIYPDMIKSAVNKMKHWIQANLKNCERCQEFYEYYKSNFDESVKFLWHCKHDFIMGEINNVIEKITPKHLRILCDVCPQVARKYFEGLQTNRKALSKYLDGGSEYFDSFICILKKDAHLYIELVESYFDEYRHSRLSPSATKYFLMNHRSKFLEKRELYTSKILNIDALANCLTAEECKELLLHLAGAKYLDMWFSYRTVEPFIKRIAPDERAAIKKQIFVDKTVGDQVEEWPYKLPSPLKEIDTSDHVFDDGEIEPLYCYEDVGLSFKRMIKKRKYCAFQSCAMMSCPVPQRTLLDQLFDRYRFTGFAKTFTELSGRLQAASSIEERQSILLVLVSKSGKVPAQVETLIKLLAERHTNEPSNLRAAIVRSLIKRGCFWRASDEVWSLMLTFAHGLGLDGGDGDPLCVEGLHAVVLRYIINNSEISKEILDRFKKHFTTFKEYGLNVVEIRSVKENLPPLLLPECPNEFLDIVKAYNVKVDNIDGAVDLLALAAKDNPDLINRLYDSKIARRQLVAQTFPIKQFEASYMNALKHDVSLLAEGESFATLASKEKTNHDRFLQLLRIYFGEVNGLAAKHLTALEEAFESSAKTRLVRPIVILSSNHIVLKKIQELDPKVSKKNAKLAAMFKVNAHKCKPAVDIDAVGWKVLGAKAIANKLFNNKSKYLEQNIKSCLQWPTTHGLALRLALNSPFEVQTFTAVYAKKPKIVLKVAVFYYFSESRTMDVKIWEIVKSILLNTDFTKLHYKLYRKLMDGRVPKNIEADFWVTIYQVYKNIKRSKTENALYKLKQLLPNVACDVIDNIIVDFIQNDLTVDNLTNYHNLSICGVSTRTQANVSIQITYEYVRIIAKYLLLCKTEKEQNAKILNILNPLFDRMEQLWTDMSDRSNLMCCLDTFLSSLKYTEMFVDKQYVSCIPMFEKVISRLQNILPRKQYFEKYVSLHFTLLYFKSIRHALAQRPNVFKEEIKDTAMELVGMQLGRYIGSEVSELISDFFVSIVDIYKRGLVDYLENSFKCNDARFKFISWIVKGLLKNDNAEAQLVAVHVLQQGMRQSSDDYHEIYNVLDKSEFQEVKFFLHANIYDKY